MADDNGTATPPAGADGQPPEGGAEGQAPDAGAAPTGETAEQRATRLEAELSRTRREAAGYRTKLKAREDADLSEAEKQAKELQALRDENNQLKAAQRSDRLQLTVASEARRLGFRNPELAFKLIADGVDFDDDGKPKNVSKLLEDIAKAEPYLVGQAPAPGATNYGNGPRGSAPGSATDMNAAIRRAAGRA